VGLGGWAAFKFLFGGRNSLGQDRIYAVDQAGSLWSYSDNGNPGNVSGPVQVGLGEWAAFKFLFAGRNLLGQNLIYAVDQAGSLWSYSDNGNFGNVSGPTQVGLAGWADFKFLFAGANLPGQDCIYAVDQAGSLWSYTDNGNFGNVSGPTQVGLGGWADFAVVFGGRDASGESRIYALEQESDRQIGQLWSYGDTGGVGNVSGGINVGLGSWSSFLFVFCGRNLNAENRIYAVEASGRLWSYGDTSNLGGLVEPVVVGLSGWEGFVFRFAGKNASGEDRIYVVDKAGRLLSYGDDGNHGNVSSPQVVGLAGWLNFVFLFCGRNLAGEYRIYAYDAQAASLYSYGDDGGYGNVSAPVTVAEQFVPRFAASQRWGWLFSGTNAAGRDCIYGVAQGDAKLVAFEDDGSPGNIALGDGVAVGVGGWGEFSLMIAGANMAGENRLYARRNDQELCSYRDDGTPGNVVAAFGRKVGLDLVGTRWVFAAGRNLAGENRLYGLERLGEPNIPWWNFSNTQGLPPFPNAQPLTSFPKPQGFAPYSTSFPGSLPELIDIVQGAEAQNLRVHAFGSSWSYSDCTYTSDYHVYMGFLNGPIQTVQNAYRPGGPSPLVFHVQAGVRLQDLNTALDNLNPPLALETMGGSSGQTLAGAISTGTHGGDKLMPPLADSVLAIHLVGAGGVQYWIEPTAAITDPQLLQEFVAPGIDPSNIIYDDTTFNACLVSLGCMGIIYAVVLRVREAYYLEETTVGIGWVDFVSRAPQLLADDPIARTRFVQLLVDPYFSQNLLTTRSEGDFNPALPHKRPVGDLGAVGAEMLALINGPEFILDPIGTVLAAFLTGEADAVAAAMNGDQQGIARLIQWMLTHGHRDILPQFYGPIAAALMPAGTFQNKSWAVMDRDADYPERSPNNKQQEPSFSIEFAFPVDPIDRTVGWVAFVDLVSEKLIAATTTILSGYIALRFTGATRAFLGMQQWNQTCSVEISLLQGVQEQDTLIATFYDAALKLGGLPHWGQMIDFTGAPAIDASVLYPQYAAWRQVYAKFSNNFTVRTFENALSVRCRLTTP
jgi:hypothetical protein